MYTDKSTQTVSYQYYLSAASASDQFYLQDHVTLSDVAPQNCYTKQYLTT